MTAIILAFVLVCLIGWLWPTMLAMSDRSPVIACVLYWTAGVLATVLVLQLMQLATS